VKHIESSDQLFVTSKNVIEDDASGRARVARDEERLLRGRQTEMRLCRYEG